MPCCSMPGLNGLSPWAVWHGGVHVLTGHAYPTSQAPIPAEEERLVDELVEALTDALNQDSYQSGASLNLSQSSFLNMRPKLGPVFGDLWSKYAPEDVIQSLTELPRQSFDSHLQSTMEMIPQSALPPPMPANKAANELDSARRLEDSGRNATVSPPRLEERTPDLTARPRHRANPPVTSEKIPADWQPYGKPAGGLLVPKGVLVAEQVKSACCLDRSWAHQKQPHSAAPSSACAIM